MTIQLQSVKHGTKDLLIDDEDYELIKNYRLYVQKGAKTFYVSYYSLETKEKGQIHRVLMNNPVGLEIDHKNGNGLDNRRENLRVGTKQQNSFNRNSKNTYSRFKGITWQKDRKRWTVAISINSIVIYGGQYKCEINAALKYNELSLKHHGEFGYINKVTDEEMTNRMLNDNYKKDENRNNTSGYRGVMWDKVKNKWLAQITINYKCKFLGLFLDKKEAAKSYINKFKEIHGYEPYKID